MRRTFRSGSSSQFLLYGNVFDLVPNRVPGGPDRPDRRDGEYVPLRRFLTETMFEPFDVVLHYDRGRGIRVRKGGEHFQRFLEAFEAFGGGSFGKLPDVRADASETLELGNLLPRDSKRALELIDRFLRGSRHRTLPAPTGGGRVPAPLKVAVLIDYVHFIAPQGEAIHLSGDLSEVLIRLLDWGSDPGISGSWIATVLVAENLGDVHRLLVESPYCAKIEIGLPSAEEIHDFVGALTDELSTTVLSPTCSVSTHSAHQKQQPCASRTTAKRSAATASCTW
jgi:hypothetical protein